jgi:hypothetical protein
MSDSSDSSDSKVGSAIYTGVATFGRVQSVIGLIVATMIALVMILVGIVVLVSSSHWSAAAMTITGVHECGSTSPADASGKTTKNIPYCVVDVAYSAAGEARTATGVTYRYTDGMPAPRVGDVVEMEYNKKTPSLVRSSGRAVGLGWGLVGLGLFVAVLGGVNTYFTFKSKGYAAVEGTMGAVGLIRSL